MFTHFDTTDWWLLAFFLIVLVFIGYDTFAVLHWGRSATFSHKISESAKDCPLIAAVMGMIFGGLLVHFFT